MALQVTYLTRDFIIDKGSGKKITLTDPNKDLSPEEVMKFYSGTHPELTNAVVTGPVVVNDRAVYNITTKAGKLG